MKKIIFIILIFFCSNSYATSTGVILQDETGNATGTSGNPLKVSLTGGGSVGIGTANTVTFWTTTSTLGSLPTATYPSLTELSYVKGVTSSIQTQIDSLSVGSGGWTDGGTNVYNTATSDNVAIGTTTPTQKLHVAGTVLATAFTATSGVNLGTSQALIGTTAMTIGNNAQTVAVNSSDWDIDATGVQTGMGNITSNGTIEGATITEGGSAVYNSGETPGGELGGTWASPTIDDSVTVTGWNLGTSAVTDDAYASGWDGSSNIPTKNAIYDKIETVSAGSGGWVDGGTNVYVSPTTDNVGIGTTTPTTGLKLDVRGAIGFQSLVGIGTTQTQLSFVEAAAGGTNVINFTAPAAITSDVNCVFENDSNPIPDSCVGDGTDGGSGGGWEDGGTNVYTTATTDNVGIGTTTPSTTLEIVKQSSQDLLMVSATATGDGNYLIIKSDGNVGVGTITPIARLAVMNGNVGIGTAAPTALFEVKGSGNNIFNLSSGNVGIGTASPMNTLQVLGTLQVDGANSMGWTPVNAANQACNTTCTSACVFGMNTGALGNFVACTDATADTCICAGPS